MISRSALSVLHVVGPSQGGIRAHVAELDRRLRSEGWRSMVAAPAGVMPPGVLTEIVEVPSGLRPGQMIAAARSLRRVAAGFDVLHLHGWKAAMVAAAARPGIPTVLTAHNLVISETAGRVEPVFRRLERSLARSAGQVIVNAPDGLDRFDGVVEPERLHFIIPVFPLPVPHRTPDEVRQELGVGGAPLIVAVSRLHPQKDLPTLLRAVRVCSERVQGVQACIAGAGPDRENLQALVTELGLTGRVHLLGNRDDAPDLMAAADVVALTSTWEGVPIVIGEALMLGRPVVMTRVGAVAAHLEDGVSARLVSVGDADGFGAALAEVLEHPQETKRLAEAGRRVGAELFDPDLLTRQVIACYRSAIDVSSGSHIPGGRR